MTGDNYFGPRMAKHLEEDNNITVQVTVSKEFRQTDRSSCLQDITREKRLGFHAFYIASEAQMTHWFEHMPTTQTAQSSSHAPASFCSP